MQCQKRKRDGERCRARTVTGKKFCSLHAEPGRPAELGRKVGFITLFNKLRVVIRAPWLAVFPPAVVWRPRRWVRARTVGSADPPPEFSVRDGCLAYAL